MLSRSLASFLAPFCVSIFWISTSLVFSVPSFGFTPSRLSRHVSQPKCLAHRSQPSRKTNSSKVERNDNSLNGGEEGFGSLLSTMGLTAVVHDNKKHPVQNSKKAYSKKSKQPNRGVPKVSLEAQLCYARNGHAVLRKFVDSTPLKCIRKQVFELAAEEELKAWRQKVQVASDSANLTESCKTVEDCQRELKSLGVTASLPFLQYFNTWRKLDEVKYLAYSLGQAASTLLDVPTVRLYQDSVFWKRADDGPTPWHADARMAPFDTSHMITFWIPLEPVPKDGTGLMFCSKSHSDFALPYWNPTNGEEQESEWDRLEHRYPKRLVDYMPLATGDITVHSGWTLHCANSNDSSVDRMALAISFVDARAEIRENVLDKDGTGDNEDQWSYQDWVHSVPQRKQFKHELVPIVWPGPK